MREVSPSSVVDVRQMIGLPPAEDQGHVDRDAAQFDQLRDLGDGNGHVLRQTLLDRCPDVRADEEGAVMVLGGGPTVAVRHGIGGNEMHQFDVLGRIGQVLQRGHQGPRRGAGGADEHMLAGGESAWRRWRPR